MAELTAAQKNDLPDSAFAIVLPGGRKDASGRTVPRSLRKFPIHDAAHIRNALARIRQRPDLTPAQLAAARRRIRAAARRKGIGEPAED